MWNVAAGLGHQVGVFDWMSTWPVEPLPGYIYSAIYPTRNVYPSEVQTIADETPANEYANPFDVRPRYKRRYELAFSLFDAWKPSVSFHFNQAIDFSHNHWADLEGGFATPQVPYQVIAPPILDAYELSDYWIGRFMEQFEANECQVIRVFRKDVKMNLCGQTRAKDSNITAALVDRFSYPRHAAKGGKGTKADPGFFFGFKSDIWQAYALGVTWLDTNK